MKEIVLSDGYTNKIIYYSNNFIETPSHTCDKKKEKKPLKLLKKW